MAISGVLSPSPSTPTALTITSSARLIIFFFFLMTRPPPISPLFPSPTFSRSRFFGAALPAGGDGVHLVTRERGLVEPLARNARLFRDRRRPPAELFRPDGVARQLRPGAG